MSNLPRSSIMTSIALVGLKASSRYGRRAQQRGKAVGDRHDFREVVDLLVVQPVGITPAIGLLVMLQNNRPDFRVHGLDGSRAAVCRPPDVREFPFADPGSRSFSSSGSKVRSDIPTS